MQKLSDLIGKKVLSLFDAKEEGTLISCYLSPALDKIVYFEIVCEENDTSLFFSTNALFSIDECVMLKNSSFLSPRSGLSLLNVACPINLPVYSPQGKTL